MLDVFVPPGAYDGVTAAGWKVPSSGWQYRNRLGLQGVTKLTVKRKAATPGVLSVTATGKNGSFPVGALPLRFTVVVEGALGLNAGFGPS